MANLKSAIRRIRTSKRNRQRNLKYKNKIKELIKSARTKIEDKLLKQAFSIIDKAALKHIIHKNRAARLKSQLMKLKPKK